MVGKCVKSLGGIASVKKLVVNVVATQLFVLTTTMTLFVMMYRALVSVLPNGINMFVRKAATLAALTILVLIALAIKPMISHLTTHQITLATTLLKIRPILLVLIISVLALLKYNTGTCVPILTSNKTVREVVVSALVVKS